MEMTLNTKQGGEWTNDDGQSFPAAPLYSYTDADGNGPGVWYSTVAQAHVSWQRWIASAPARARRAAENARYREAAAAADARERSEDPFARF